MGNAKSAGNTDPADGGSATGAEYGVAQDADLNSVGEETRLTCVLHAYYKGTLIALMPSGLQNSTLEDLPLSTESCSMLDN